MTDRIDLDELDASPDGPAERPNRGDWLWREEGDPEDEPAPPPTGDGDAGAGSHDDAGADEGVDAAGDAGGNDDAGGRDDPVDAADTPAVEGGRQATPHVPHPSKDKPVGIPIEGGGAGGGPGRDRQPGEPRSEGDAGGSEGGAGAHTKSGTDADVASDDDGEADPSSPEPTTVGASGPHGGGVDDMTMAFTYAAVTRLADPSRVVADASRWADWIGLVGDVEAYVINKFQRDHGVDVDFFNGSGTGPGERLAEIDEHSMFFAERMVVVGVEGADESIARTAGWEFVPVTTAAGKADWELAE